MPTGKRIKHYREKMKWTLEELASRSGVEVGTISALENRDSERSKFFEAIARAFSLSVEQLSDQKRDWVGINSASTPTTPEETQGIARIRPVSLRLSCGVKGFEVDEDEDTSPTAFFREKWIKNRGYKTNKLIAIKVKGRSMEPTLHEGDTVIINTEDTEPKDSECYAINYEGQPMIQRLIRDSGTWWMQSDNPDKTRHPNKRCEGDRCLLIGHVVHKQSEII